MQAKICTLICTLSLTTQPLSWRRYVIPCPIPCKVPLLAVASLVLLAGLVSKGNRDIVVAEGGSTGGAVQAEEGGSDKTFSLDGTLGDLDGLVEVVKLVGLV